MVAYIYRETFAEYLPEIGAHKIAQDQKLQKSLTPGDGHDCPVRKQLRSTDVCLAENVLVKIEEALDQSRKKEVGG
jgi:hypothetical protein